MNTRAAMETEGSGRLRQAIARRYFSRQIEREMENGIWSRLFWEHQAELKLYWAKQGPYPKDNGDLWHLKRAGRLYDRCAHLMAAVTGRTVETPASPDRVIELGCEARMERRAA